MKGVRVLTSLVAVLASGSMTSAQCPEFSPLRVLNEYSQDDGDAFDDRPALASSNGGRALAVWRTFYDISGTSGADSEIVFTLSDDSGVTWNSSSFLNTDAATDTRNDDSPRVATDDGGVWVTIWQSELVTTPTSPLDSDILFSRSVDYGASWSAPAILTSNMTADSAYDAEADIATDGNGTWIVVWHSLQTSVDGMQIGSDDDILCSVSTDNGLSWSDTQVVNTDAASDSAIDRRVSIVPLGNSTFAVAWDSASRSGGDADLYLARTTDGGSSWSAPAPINTDYSMSGNDYGVKLTVGSSGPVGALWYSDNPRLSTGSDFDIFLARSTDAGVTWSDPAVVNSNATTDSGEDAFPFVKAGTGGGWFAVWRTKDTLGGTIGADNDMLFACSQDSGSSWSQLQTLNDAGNDLTATDGAAATLTFVQGNWIIGWNSGWDPISETVGDFDIHYRTTAALPIDLDVFIID